MLKVQPAHNTPQTPLFVETMNSNTPSATNDEGRKVRLPSIFNIAPSLPQLTPLKKPVSPTSLDRNNEINKLKAAAEIFSSSKKMDLSPKTSPLLPQQPSQPQPQPQTVPQQLAPQLAQHPSHTAYSPTSTPAQQLQPKFYSPVYQQPPVPAYTTLPPNQYAVPPQYSYQHPGMIPQPFYGHYTVNPMQQHVRVRAPRRQSKNQERKIKPNLVCQRCGITDTPEWRKGPNGARTLCNACGLFHAKILKKEGPEAAANAISGGKIRKRSVQRKSYNAVSDQVLQQFPPNGIPLPSPGFPQYQQHQVPPPSMYYVPQGSENHHVPLVAGPGGTPMNYPPVLMIPGAKSPVVKDGN